MKPADKYQFKHHFVPHPERKERATLLSNQFIFMYTLVMVFLLGVLRLVPLVLPGVLSYASDINIEMLVAETNKAREQNNLPLLRLNSELSSAAERKANDMFQNNYWAHVSPVGTKPWDFIISSGYDYSFAGENLAKNFNSSDEVVQAWLDSPSHRENIMNANYEDVGFAVVNGTLEGYETTLVVQMFGKSRNGGFVASAFSDSEVAEVPVQVPEPIEVPVVATDTDVTTQNTPNVVLSINLVTVSRVLLGTFGIFIVSLLSLDIWYSCKKGILKFTGHTVAHVTFLLFILVSVWVVMSPGRII